MEDTFCHQDQVGRDSTCGIFAIFDGHGGRHVADHCAEMFPREITKEINSDTVDLKPVFEKVFT